MYAADLGQKHLCYLELTTQTWRFCRLSAGQRPLAAQPDTYHASFAAIPQAEVPSIATRRCERKGRRRPNSLEYTHGGNLCTAKHHVHFGRPL